jgi:hypothetical protein
MNQRWRIFVPALAYLLGMLAVVQIWSGIANAAFGLFAPVAMMLAASTRTSWDLLEIRRTRPGWPVTHRESWPCARAAFTNVTAPGVPARSRRSRPGSIIKEDEVRRYELQLWDTGQGWLADRADRGGTRRCSTVRRARSAGRRRSPSACSARKG